jgi:hypothetical protein
VMETPLLFPVDQVNLSLGQTAKLVISGRQSPDISCERDGRESCGLWIGFCPSRSAFCCTIRREPRRQARGLPSAGATADRPKGEGRRRWLPSHRGTASRSCERLHEPPVCRPQCPAAPAEEGSRCSRRPSGARDRLGSEEGSFAREEHRRAEAANPFGQKPQGQEIRIWEKCTPNSST